MSVLTGHRDGETYEPPRDYHRLNRQMIQVYTVVADEEWWQIQPIQQKIVDYGIWAEQTSISARLRDFRKAKFGSHGMIKENLGGGLWQYRLTWNIEIPRPTQDEVNKAFEH